MVRGRAENEVLGIAIRGRVRGGAPLARFSSFRIGGPARWLVEPADRADLARLLRGLDAQGVEPVLLGLGTNVLLGDREFTRPVIVLGKAFDFFLCRATARRAYYRVGAATVLKKVVTTAVRGGDGGLEWAEGIPGTVGGGLRMNAGAYHGELKDVTRELAMLDARGRVRRWTGARIPFRYRALDLPRGWIITEATFALRPEGTEAVRGRLDEIRSRRRNSQPLGLPNAGCIFKNPAGDSAGRMIDALGLKGTRRGGAEISTVHANFIVN
ncbi:MAG: UDP-N-acetylmuramate dehydrogenase, partial [Myxococcales bacterium]|nr:UDP-N-acetylmuramate dehydrogenase [Myxococcales bacterium]